MYEDGDNYGWESVKFTTSDGYQLVMMHIKNDDMENELNDQINFPPVLHIHSIEEDGRDFISGDTINNRDFFRARRAAYPTRLY